jgi:DNA methylase
MTDTGSMAAQSERSYGEVSFDDWIGGRSIDTLGTNAGAEIVPFQAWRHFKEAFAPELIRRAISESPIPVHHCLDPFSGSGTTALACQFLGVRPTAIEVNPYLADLSEAKLAKYDIGALARDFAALVKAANRRKLSPWKFFSGAPPTFVEPGIGGRWIFDVPVAARLAAYVASLSVIDNPVNRRLLRVLLGGVLIGLSNVVVSGKGRRYRSGWKERQLDETDLDEAFCEAVEGAVGDIVRHGERAEHRYTVLRGDARRLLKKVKPVEVAIFSPPYPNSFDYTDVYNVELWGLQYLNRAEDNTRLRLSTLTSHVQIMRRFASPPEKSALLKRTLRELSAKRADLWDRRIPDMVGGYFADMVQVIQGIAGHLPRRGQLWMVVGDSRYAGVPIPVAEILGQLAPGMRCRLITKEPFRSMRTSAQQGGSHSLHETLVVLSRT